MEYQVTSPLPSPSPTFTYCYTLTSESIQLTKRTIMRWQQQDNRNSGQKEKLLSYEKILLKWHLLRDPVYLCVSFIVYVPWEQAVFLSPVAAILETPFWSVKWGVSKLEF